jgi:hypothetical protein
MSEPTQPDADMAEKAIADIRAVRGQAHRYLVARYGKDYIYRAPETFGNTLERWIWAVGADAEDLAEECMKAIEEYFGGEGQ